MAATTGTYGSRKSEGQFPRLTGKAAFDIGRYRYNEESRDKGIYKYDESLDTDEIKFVLGMLLCNLWKNGDESVIDHHFYDVTFASVKDDPVGCVKLFLRSKDVELGRNDSRFYDLMDNSFKLGYITSDPVPYIGGISFLDNQGNKYDHSTVDEYRRYPSTSMDTRRFFDGIATNEDNPDKLNWDVLLWQTARGAYEVYEYVDDSDHPQDKADALVSLNDANQLKESYDTEVRSLIEKGNIVLRGQTIGKVILS
jgi:hypothetical protein